MLPLLQYIIATLTNDSILNAIVPSAQIFSGAVDIATQFQNNLEIPQVNIHVINEAVRTVPLNVRDTVIQIDIWSRNNYLETVNISERILTLLDFQSPVIGTAKVMWMRLDSTVDMYESERRIWHRVLSIKSWGIEGQ